MKLAHNELTHITHNEKLPQQIKDKIYHAIERTKLIEVIDTCDEASMLNEINEILSVIINKRDRVEEVSNFIYKMYEEEKMKKELDEMYPNGIKSTFDNKQQII